MAKNEVEELLYTNENFEIMVKKLIQDRKSFVVYGLSRKMIEAVSNLEKFVEETNLTCRVYTLNRAAAAAGVSWTGFGTASWLAIASHNLATFNPDYEIGRDLFKNRLHINYKKAKRDEKLRKKEAKKKDEAS
ncbi:hypothetical protein [Halomonas sp.]|uniref:hypothetical protein n=1 Tax=Halomonas sp. TaxID=1486246 RepID=UPI003A91DEDF